ncbi:pilus assembly protein TadG-related protein [Arthrobacter monumenti]
MRRLTKSENSDRGAVSIVVAILMVALLGFAALVIDVGLMYAERAQLQNGADAAAISIAQSCAEDPTDATVCSDTSPLAKTLANENANDGLTNVQNIGLDTTARIVSVTTGAKETGGGENRISLFFARALGFESAEIGAHASAAWGTPSEGPAPFPITFSKCEIEDGYELQLIQYYAKSSEAPSCLGGPPGGFSKLDADGEDCEARVDVDENSAGSDPGNDGPKECTALLASWQASILAGENPIVLFPIHDSVTGTGNTASYDITGFAAFEIYGWKFKQGGSGEYEFRSNYGGFACTGHCIGIIGKFVQHVVLDEEYTSGASEDFGASVVHMTMKEGAS